MKTKIKTLGREIYKNRALYLMTAPFAILFFIFVIVTVVAAICLSFTHYNLIEAPVFCGLDNYVRMLLDDDILLIAAKNTLIFAVITGPLSYMICLFFAWMINELPKYMRMLMTFVFYAPSISGSVYVVWSYIFSSDSYGLINSVLIRLGIINEPVLWLSDTRYIMTIIIIVQLWSSLGTSFLSFIAGFQGIDKSLYEAGAIDGIRDRFQELFYITLPSMGPQLMFAAVMQIGAAFSVSGICNTLAGNPSTDYAAHTVVTHISDYALTRYEMGYASALSVVLFLVMIFTNEFIGRFLHKHTDF